MASATYSRVVGSRVVEKSSVRVGSLQLVSKSVKPADLPVIEAADSMRTRVSVALLRTVEAVKDGIPLKVLGDKLQQVDLNGVLQVLDLDNRFQAAAKGAGLQPNETSFLEAIKDTWAAGARAELDSLNTVPVRKDNPCHKPAGTSEGGQFCETGGGKPVWEMTKDEFIADPPHGFKYEAPNQFNDGNIAWFKRGKDFDSGTITVTDSFFEHNTLGRKSTIRHEQAHRVESELSPEVKALVWDSEIGNFRGRNINEKLANWIAADKPIPKEIKDLIPDTLVRQASSIGFDISKIAVEFGKDNPCHKPAGTSEGGQFCSTDGGGVSVSDLLMQGQKELEDHQSTSPLERMMVFDADTGEKLQDYVGSENSTDRSTYGGGLLHLDHNVVEMHSHPDTSSFSDGDWKAFAWSNVVESRVVGRDYVFTLRKGDEYNSRNWSEHTPAKVGRRFNDILDEKTELPGWDLNTILDDVNTQMAKEFGATFAMKARVGKSDISKASNTIGLALAFDLLNPETIAWLSTYVMYLIQQVSDETRRAIADVVMNAFQYGGHPYEQARTIRNMIGLTQSQSQAVANFRRMLENEPLAALTRDLRDHRFDATLQQVGRMKGQLSKEQIDKMSQRYYERYLKYRAEMIARTETIRAARMGQEATWRQAIAQGLLPQGMKRKWVVTYDDRLCAACKSIPRLNPEGRGMDEQFMSDIGTVDGPPLHPHCRCAVVRKVDWNA